MAFSLMALKKTARKKTATAFGVFKGQALGIQGLSATHATVLKDAAIPAEKRRIGSPLLQVIDVTREVGLQGKSRTAIMAISDLGMREPTQGLH